MRREQGRVPGLMIIPLTLCSVVLHCAAKKLIKERNVNNKTRELQIKELAEAAGNLANEYRYKLNQKGYH